MEKDELKEFNKSSKSPSGFRSECKECVYKYNHSLSGKAASKKYRTSEKWLQKGREFKKTDEYKAKRKLLRQKSSVKEKERLYSISNERRNELRKSKKEQRIKYNENRKNRARIMPKFLRKQVIEEEQNCRYCQNPASVIDHIISVFEGGQHTRVNLQRLCDSCNKRKTAMEAKRRRLKS